MPSPQPPPPPVDQPNATKPSYARRFERLSESVLFNSRWLLAPFFFGLALSIFMLMIKFIQELVHIATSMFAAPGTQVVAEVLGLVDLTLTASLLIIVVFSGYENFVSRIDHTQHRDWPEWMGSIDFTGLKLKLLSSIVAISAVQVLRLFLGLQTTSDREFRWSLMFHVVFVVSSVLLALSDRISGGSHDAASAAKEGAKPDPSSSTTSTEPY